MADKPVNREKKNPLLRDAVLAILLLAVGLSAFFIVRANEKPGKTVTVYHDGEPVGTYSLFRNGSYEINGGTHILVIEDGTACVTDADCPNLLCEKRGKISAVGESIVCLPNRVEIRVDGENGADIVLP